jgi:hypothetical protein
MQISTIGNTSSTAVILGEFSGLGGFIGGGDMFALGDLRPGASPASVLMDGNVFLGSTTDTFIELSGLRIGEFDQMVVTGDLFLGGDLFVELLGDFALGYNMQFEIVDVRGVLSGQFTGTGEGDLVGNYGGHDLFVSYVGGDGNNVALFTKGIAGDVNLDGNANGLDVDPFVNVLLSGAYQAGADINQDGEVNGLDVDPFVAAVLGSGAHQIPEPSTLLLAIIALGVLSGWRKWGG